MNPNTYTYRYPRPMVTVDAVVFQMDRTSSMVHRPDTVLLIQRKYPPFADHWALPGGFVEMDEDLKDAAKRELEEETGLAVDDLRQVGAFGRPGRDPRGRNISIAFWGICPEPLPDLQGADDARLAAFHPIDRLPPLAFDHKEILMAASECAVLSSNKKNSGV